MTTSLLLSPEELGQPEVTIVGDRYRHLFRARRQKVGDRMRVVDGRGRARWAQVIRIDRLAGYLELADEAPRNEPEVWLELFVVAGREEHRDRCQRYSSHSLSSRPSELRGRHSRAPATSRCGRCGAVTTIADT